MRKVIITGLVSACLLAAGCVKITSQPSDLTVNHGGQAAFMVAANGIGTISYQWEMYISATDSWAPITGATSGTYAIGPVDYEKDNGSKYRCVLKDSTGSKATTTEAKLAVVLKPAVITGQPESQVIAAGRTDVNFSVSAEGDDLMYSWVIRLSDGIDIRYSAGPYNSLTISEVTQTYNNSRVWCEVSNAIGSVKSDEAVLKVVGSDILFVNINVPAEGKNDGSSWANAFSDLQSALALALNNNSYTQIWVAAGTYYPTRSTDRSIYFRLVHDVAHYGGFSGSGLEASISERDIRNNPTILSGDIGILGDNSDNSYKVVSGTPRFTLDGFTVTGGNAAGSTASGGGLSNGGSNSIIANCTFTGNSSVNGGAIYNAGRGLKITNCKFMNNNANEGGAIYFVRDLIISNSLFSGNTAAVYGGAIVGYQVTGLVMSNCTVTGNNASEWGGGLYLDSYVSPIINNSIIWGNTSPREPEIGKSFLSYEEPVASYSDIECRMTNPGPGNFYANPLFTDSTSGDFSLQAGSPCIDAGSNALVPADILADLLGNPRIIDILNIGGSGVGIDGFAVDMGAFEYLP